MLFSFKILGSGTSIPSPGRRAPAYLVDSPGGQILLDCGSGALGSAVDAGMDLLQFKGVLLTHLHLDHTADLAPLLFAYKNPICGKRPKPLTIWGPSGTAKLLEGLRGVYGSWVQPEGLEVVVSELMDGHRLDLDPLSITARRVEHSGECLAFRIQRGDAVACFSGDTGPCPGLQRAAQDADVLAVECAFLENDCGSGHMRPSDVGRLAAEAGCGQVVLTHLYPHVLSSDPLPHVQAHFKGTVWLAEDGMQVSFDEEGGIVFRLPAGQASNQIEVGI